MKRGLFAVSTLLAALLGYWTASSHPVFRAPAPVALAPVTRVPAAPAALADAGAAAVRVFGRVVDDRGAPVTHAALQLTWFPSQTGRGSRTEFGVDAQGRFEQRVAPGVIVLEAAAKGFVTSSRQTQAAEGEWDVELALEPTVELRGQVVTADGKPLEDFQVWGRRLREPAGARELANSSPGGEFSLEVGPGDVLVQASSGELLGAQAVVRAPASGVRLVLKAGAELKGRARDESGMPVAAATVKVLSEDHNVARTAVTAFDGTFRVAGLPDGTCEVSAQAQSGGPSRMRAGLNGVAKVKVRAAKAPFVELRLARDKAVRGRVVDEADQPLGGVTVVATPGTPLPRRDVLPYHMLRVMALLRSRSQLSPQAPVEASPEATSAADGTFELLGLGIGSYTLSARTERLADNPEAPLIVQPGIAPVVLRLLPVRHLTARVVGEDGQRISRVFVGGEPVEAPGGLVKTEIRFNYHGDLSLSAAGYSPVTQEVTLSTLADTELGTVRLARGRSLKPGGPAPAR